MASKKSRKTSKRSAAKATSAKRSSESYAYSDRIPIIADTLKTDFGGSATITELFKALKTKSGEFNKPRRIAATVRYDVRENGDASVLVRDGKSVTLRAKTRSKKSARPRKSKKSKSK